MHTNHDVWVVVPTYNEAPVVGDTVTELRRSFPKVVAVDDGSTDGSGDKVRAAGGRVVRHPINMGYGAAIQTGIEFALHDPSMKYVVTFDADGQHRVDDAAAMVDRARESGVGVVIGSRFLGSNAVGMSAAKRMLLKSAVVFERATSGIQLTDAHQGLKVFDRSFAEVLDLQAADMSSASEFLHRLAEVKPSYEEFPIVVAYTDYSRSKGQRSVNAINIGVDVLMNQILRGHR